MKIEISPYKYGPLGGEVRFKGHRNAFVTKKRTISDREFTGEVYTQHGELVADSLRPSRKAAFVHKAMPPNLDSGLEGPFLPGRSLFLGHVFEMFGHDLIELGTRCWPALKKEVNFDRVVVLKWRESSSNIQVKMNEPAKTIIDLLFGFPEVYVADAPITRFEELYVPSPAFFINDTYHSICSSVFEAIAEKAVASAKQVATDGKIYLSRSRLPGKKRFEFEDAIERAAKEADYIIVHPESLSFGSQINIMRNAEFVSGLDGSAMHLCAFSKKNTKILCFDTRQVTNQLCIEEIAVLQGSHVNIKSFKITRQLDAYNLAKCAFRKIHAKEIADDSQ